MVSIGDNSTGSDQAAASSTLFGRLYGLRNVLAAAGLVLFLLAVTGQLGWLVAAIAFAAIAGLGSILPMPGPDTPEAIDVATQTMGAQLEEAAAEADAAPLDPGMLDLVQAVPAPLAIIDQRADLVAANAEFAEMFGEGMTGTSALIRFRNPDVQDAIRSATEDRTLSGAEFADRGRLGRWFDVTAVPLGQSEDSAGYCILYFRDMSEARRLEKMRTDFVGNASHELRTPLASLKGYLETLAGAARNDPDARERFIGIMLEQADRMERLIDDLLSLSRFETGLGKAAFEDTDLSDTLFHVRSALAPMAEKYGAELDFDDEELVAEAHLVHGSRDELIQLFENLVENAIKYGADDTQVRVGLITAREFGREVFKVTVSDNGPGIASEHIPRLTERFYRVDVQSSRERQGTGLGLAIVKHILTRHDGYLSVTSELGQGSDFTVTIPKLVAE